MGEQPQAYRTLLKLGWRWASVDAHVPHLVPPHGDMALCLHICERTRRKPVFEGIAARGCRRCMHQAGITPPNPRSKPPLELPARADEYPGQ